MAREIAIGQQDYAAIIEKNSFYVDKTFFIKDWWNDRQEIIGDEIGEKSRVFSAQQLLDMDCNFDQCKFPKNDEEILPPAELLADYFKKRKALDHEIDKTLAEIQRILGIEVKIDNCKKENNGK